MTHSATKVYQWESCNDDDDEDAGKIKRDQDSSVCVYEEHIFILNEKDTFSFFCSVLNVGCSLQCHLRSYPRYMRSSQHLIAVWRVKSGCDRNDSYEQRELRNHNFSWERCKIIQLERIELNVGCHDKKPYWKYYKTISVACMLINNHEKYRDNVAATRHFRLWR